MRTPADLKRKLPYQFEGRNIGLSIPKGWFPAFANLCEDIDQLLGANHHGFHWVQLKEKFGAARWYWSMGHHSEVHVNFLSADGVTALVSPPSALEAQQVRLRCQLSALIDPAEEATHEQCIVCGAPGKLDRLQGYVLVLCERHAQQRKVRTMDSAWFTEDEL